MAARDVLVLNEDESKIQVVQVGDTYNCPRSVNFADGWSIASTAVTVSASQINEGIAIATASTVSTLSTVKIYRALLNQSGDGTTTLTSGTLTIGKRYKITAYNADDDFSNVANVVVGTINTLNCEFIATGTIPIHWVHLSELTDTAAPVATVLENSLGGDVVWSRAGVGSSCGTLVGAFTVNKTIRQVIQTLSPVEEGFAFISGTLDDIILQTYNVIGELVENGYLLNTPIEILVYP